MNSKENFYDFHKEETEQEYLKPTIHDAIKLAIEFGTITNYIKDLFVYVTDENGNNYVVVHEPEENRIRVTPLIEEEDDEDTVYGSYYWPMLDTQQIVDLTDKRRNV